MRGKFKKYLLVITLFGASILVGVCNAMCFGIPLKTDNDTRGCFHEGKIHEYGSSWRTEDCWDCSCSVNHISCCKEIVRVEFNKKKCIEIFDKEACVFSVVRKNNPKKSCPFTAVG